MKATEWKVGMSSCYKKGFTREMFEEYRDSGIDMMEVSIGNLNHGEIAWDQIKKYAADCGVKLWSFHLPFCPFDRVNIADLTAEGRKKSVEILGEYLKIAGSLETPVAVIHPSGEPNKPENRSEHIKAACDCLVTLSELAAREGITIAVEDLPRTCIGNSASDILALLEADPRIGVCFDTNHLLEEKNPDFVRAVGDKIITLHVSDYDMRNERHWLPGEGKIDWVELVTMLEDCGYEGPWMYEIGAATPKSISRPRELCCADFRTNYELVTAKKAPIVIGTPNEDVCLADAYIKSCLHAI